MREANLETLALKPLTLIFSMVGKLEIVYVKIATTRLEILKYPRFFAIHLRINSPEYKLGVQQTDFFVAFYEHQSYYRSSKTMVSSP